jgi:hypothetical protein
MTDLFPSSPMPHNLDNPFRDAPSGTEDARIIEKTLGKSAADAYRRVTDPQNPEKPRGLVLTPEQEAKIKASQERTVEDIVREQKKPYFDLAAHIGKDEQWVDETFTFHDDETVTAEKTLYLDFLTDPQLFPNNLSAIYGSLFLSGLTSAEHLVLPREITAGLCLDGLTSVENLTLPKRLGWNLSLNSLTSAKNLVFPVVVEGDLFLVGLTTAEGFTPPEVLTGAVFLDALSEKEKSALKVRYPHIRIG